MRSIIIILIGLFLFSSDVSGQYFGKNKPRYRSFDFKVKRTGHYDLYYYIKNKEVVDRFGQWSEMWYDHHNKVFNDSIDFYNPILLYNDHADFQQNNAISAALGPGTGGVTEAFKNRVVMPLTFTHQQTNHVLGHELVHAFQFNNIVRGDSTSLKNLGNLPLWMSEGLAEYLSLGGEDSHTALWMRDAVANDDIPAIKDLRGHEYFPYRYGHALWSFMSGYFGDDKIAPLYNATSRVGVAQAMDSLFSISQENISSMYQNALKTYFSPLIENRDAFPKGRNIINPDNSGNINVSPIISPNGKMVVFLSERDLVSTDLFLANVNDGRVVKKLVSITNEGADHLNYMESAGTWSPDSRRFAYVVFKKGRNAINIKNVETNDTESIIVKKVPAISNPAWSPDGKYLVFTGKVEGQVDLYRYTLKTGRTEQLTDDVYSEVGANFSPDGSTLVFSYDKRSFSGETYDGMYTLDLATMDLTDNKIEILDVFHGADNVSPVFDHEGNILFLSDRDGFRDAYMYKPLTLEVHRLTTLKTGISGITRYSPAISAARNSDKFLVSVYNDKKYSIHRIRSSKVDKKLVDGQLVKKVGAILPPRNLDVVDIVDENLRTQSTYDFVDASSFKNQKYRPQFKLDYIGGIAGVGVNNNTFNSNTNLQGGVQALFSDILGNNQLFAGVSLNGELLDAGGQFTFINRKHRLAFGLGLGHISGRTGFQRFANDRLNIDGTEVDVLRRDLNILRVFNESVNAFVHYPFSTTLRLEGGVTGFYQHFRQDLIQDYYLVDDFGRTINIAQQREQVPTGDQIVFNQFYTLTKGAGVTANIALVKDNATFGLTGPIAGQRIRLSLENQMGIDNYFATLVDARKYVFKKPFTFALRGLNYNRFERETNSVYPNFIGSMGFVRGFTDIYSDQQINPTINFDRMIGSKIAMVSAEIRLPFTGPKKLALLGSSILFSDLVFFFDAGVAFDEFSQIRDGRPTREVTTNDNDEIIYGPDGFPIYDTEIVKPLLAKSAGVSLRFNVGGAIIIEPFYARQLVENGRWDFGLNFIPGW